MCYPDLRYPQPLNSRPWACYKGKCIIHHRGRNSRRGSDPLVSQLARSKALVSPTRQHTQTNRLADRCRPKLVYEFLSRVRWARSYPTPSSCIFNTSSLFCSERLYPSSRGMRERCFDVSEIRMRHRAKKWYGLSWTLFLLWSLFHVYFIILMLFFPFLFWPITVDSYPLTSLDWWESLLDVRNMYACVTLYDRVKLSAPEMLLVFYPCKKYNTAAFHSFAFT